MAKRMSERFIEGMPADPVAVDAGLMAALRQKAKGERNSVGDVWGDHICADAADRIASLHAALQAAEERGAERMRWQPIETAPKDGTTLILARFQWLWDTGEAEVGSLLWRERVFGGAGATRKYQRCWVAGGFWSSKWSNWNDGIEPSGLNNPTHYMLMPPDAALLTDKET